MAVFDPLRTLALRSILLSVRNTQIALRLLFAACTATLAGCDPGVHVAWEQDFEGAVSADCVERALRTVSPDVTRSTYVDNGIGPRGFGEGITVTQFNYSDPTFAGSYALDMARLPNGKTRYWHQWGKIGTDIPDEEQAKVLPLLNRANQAVAQRCGLSFTETGPREGDG